MTVSIWNAPTPSANYDAEQAQRVAYFNKIAPTPNWKMPINTWIGASDLENCKQACVFFAGCKLTVVARKGRAVHVTAPGYYASVGA
jgi:hypothetical protein